MAASPDASTREALDAEVPPPSSPVYDADAEMWPRTQKLADGLLSGNRSSLSKAITLSEASVTSTKAQESV